MNTTEIIGVIDKVKAVLDEAKVQHRYYNHIPYKDQIEEFLNAINPAFPTDSVDVLDLLMVVLQGERLPDQIEFDILNNLMKQAEFTHGDFRWNYKHPVLIGQFSPKRAGNFYKIIFSPAKVGDGPLTFPLKVEVLAYTDMDEKESHNEYCPIYYPEHEEDCPLRVLWETKPDASEEEYKRAEEECECAADDCNCESEVERIHERIFKDNDDFQECGDWLAKAHWNAFEPEVGLVVP